MSETSTSRRPPTLKEDIALSFIFEFMNETRINRSYQKYMDIAGRLPPLKVLHAKVNELLLEYHNKLPDKQICYFRSGDLTSWFDEYPSSLSIETIRSALYHSGMREPRARSCSKSGGR